jgi:hypothetical protein
MVLLLKRTEVTPQSTCGMLFIDGAERYHTLELPLGDGKPGSAIPAGRYEIGPFWSRHFQRTMPLIIGIPGRSEIEIHWGDVPHDTRGCILIGFDHFGPNEIEHSIAAWQDFWARVSPVLFRGQVWITVQNAVPPTAAPAMGVGESTL